MHERADMANKMLQAGAIAYLSKGGPAEQLLAEVRKAANLAGKGKS
jgi:DNA-binding NarL/FixJ family response regulator